MEGGVSTAYALDTIQERGRLFIDPQEEIYEGMIVGENSRNEDMVYLRGFDVRQVPLFIDGIPAYVPYDGYVDFGRFTTFDLAQIRVAASGASLMYGPNTLGGAINLVSRKPVRAFEGFSMSLLTGAGTGSAAGAATTGGATATGGAAAGGAA